MGKQENGIHWLHCCPWIGLIGKVLNGCKKKKRDSCPCMNQQLSMIAQLGQMTISATILLRYTHLRLVHTKQAQLFPCPFDPCWSNFHPRL